MSLVRRLFLENIGLKALSLLLAILLWLQIGGQKSVQRIVSIPLEFINMPKDLEIASDFERRVNVIIRSNRPGANIDESRFAAVIDMEAARPGDQIIPLSEANIEYKPPGVSVVNLLTSRVRLRLERVFTRTLPVEVRTQGVPAEGFEVTSVRVEPGEVTIAGPESRVKLLNRVMTEPVNLAGATSSVTRDVYLDVLDSRVRVESSAQVNVRVAVAQAHSPAPLEPGRR